VNAEPISASARLAGRDDAFFKAFCNGTRAGIVEQLLAGGALRLRDHRPSGHEPALVSHHLAILREQGSCARGGSGARTYYSIDWEQFERRMSLSRRPFRRVCTSRTPGLAASAASRRPAQRRPPAARRAGGLCLRASGAGGTGGGAVGRPIVGVSGRRGAWPPTRGGDQVVNRRTARWHDEGVQKHAKATQSRTR